MKESESIQKNKTNNRNEEIEGIFRKIYTRMSDLYLNAGPDDGNVDYEKLFDLEEEEETNVENIFNYTCEYVNTIFPDYKKDESFGGTSKFIKIEKERGEYVVYYIDPDLIKHIYLDARDDDTEDYSSYDDDIICRYDMEERELSDSDYFLMLLQEGKIGVGQIYDINSSDFVDKIMKTKISIQVDDYSKKYPENIFDEVSNCILQRKITELIGCDICINGNLYGTTLGPYGKRFNPIRQFNDLKNFGVIRVYIREDMDTDAFIKIGSKFYSEEYLRKYIPYLIRQDNEDNYYILNRDYEYIGLNTHSVDYQYKKEYYLFNDGSKPYYDESNYSRLCGEYKKIIADNNLGKCLNFVDDVAKVLSLLD